MRTSGPRLKAAWRGNENSLHPPRGNPPEQRWKYNRVQHITMPAKIGVDRDDPVPELPHSFCETLRSCKHFEDDATRGRSCNGSV